MHKSLLRFFLFYNVIYLGILLFFIFLFGSLLLNSRVNTGIWWAFDYSFIVAFLYLSFLMLGFVSWVYGTIKTLLIYRKIESKKFILNLVPLVWLFLVPTAITLTAKYWINFYLFLTEPLFRFLR